METTFDKFITNDVKQKVLFEKEYTEFSRKEKALENSEKERKAKSFAGGNKKYATV